MSFRHGYVSYVLNHGVGPAEKLFFSLYYTYGESTGQKDLGMGMGRAVIDVCAFIKE